VKFDVIIVLEVVNMHRLTESGAFKLAAMMSFCAQTAIWWSMHTQHLLSGYTAASASPVHSYLLR